MTGKMTNTIRPSTASLGLPHVSDLIHLKPHMAEPCSGAVHPPEWKSLKKQKQQILPTCFLPHSSTPRARLGASDADVQEEYFLIVLCFGAVDVGQGPSSVNYWCWASYLTFLSFSFLEETLHNLMGWQGGQEEVMQTEEVGRQGVWEIVQLW